MGCRSLQLLYKTKSIPTKCSSSAAQHSKIFSNISGEASSPFDKNKVFQQVEGVVEAGGLHDPQQVGLVGVGELHLNYSYVNLI